MARRTDLPKHCYWSRDRHRKMRIRFRKGTFSTYIYAEPGTLEFSQAYHAALDGVKLAKQQIGARRHKPGSIAALVLSYYHAPEFLGLKQSTRATYRGILDRFVAQHGSKPVYGLERQHIKAIVGKMDDRPAAANNLLRMLKMVLEYAVDVELIARNPARGLRGFKVRSTGFATWSEADIAAYEKRHPIGTKARLAMALMLYLGQRRGDVVQLGWQHVEGERIRVRQEKTGKPLVLRMHAALIEALSAAPRDNLTFLVTEFGAPFTAAGFGNWFRARCDEAGLQGRAAHGLRKAAARRLAQAGNSTRRIAAVTGHQTLKEIECYTREVEQETLADEAIATMPDRSDREQSFPNRRKRLGKNAVKERK